MDLLPGIEAMGLGLYIKAQSALVISDLHIGFEEEQRSRGVFMPRFQLKDELAQLESILALLPPLDAVIINGDLKHEFARISDQEWREILKLFDFILRHAKRIILVKGNHDMFLAPIAKKRDIELVQHYEKDGVYIMHGHEIPENEEFKKAKTVIIGNEHPAVVIKDSVRSEKYKCFLRGKWKKKDVLVLPSFNPLTIGTDVLRGEFLSPILKGGLDAYDMFVTADSIYPFGAVKKLLLR